MGLTGSLPSSENRFATKSIGNEESAGRNGGRKTYKMRRFDVLRVATGSYTVELKRIASRKLFKQVPGLQDVKNGPKRTKTVTNPEKSDFAGFLAVFSVFFL